MRYWLTFFFLIFLPLLAAAQTDSVVVTGQIRHLTARLYRESPAITVSRNNILQPSRELIRRAPLGADGTFRLVVPLIYPQEELNFSFNRAGVSLLAAPGSINLVLDADSLFVAAVPFQFAGVNAQVNNQYARYQAFDASQQKITNKQLIRLVQDKPDAVAFRLLSNTFLKSLTGFAVREPVFPLVQQLVGSQARYYAAAFLYDKALATNNELPTTLADSLRPANDPLLTTSRVIATGRFGDYTVQRTLARQLASGKGSTLSIRNMASLLLAHTPRLTAQEQARLQAFAATDAARAADLRFLQQLMTRNPDTLQRLTSYATLIEQTKNQSNSLSSEYIWAYLLAKSLPGLTLDFAGLLYQYLRPQLTEKRLVQSLDELYALETSDSTRIRTAMRQLPPGQSVDALELGEGIFVTRNAKIDGNTLLDRALARLRGKVVYLLAYDPTDEAGRQAALNAQQLRDFFRIRELTLLYVNAPGAQAATFLEFAIKHKLLDNHLVLTDDQWESISTRFPPEQMPYAAILGRSGKPVKLNAPLPAKPDEARALIQKQL